LIMRKFVTAAVVTVCSWTVTVPALAAGDGEKVGENIGNLLGGSACCNGAGKQKGKCRAAFKRAVHETILVKTHGIPSLSQRNVTEARKIRVRY